MDTSKHLESFLPLKELATRLGVPAAWLKNEAAAGRVPCLKVGRRMFFNYQKVESALIAQSEAVARD